MVRLVPEGEGRWKVRRGNNFSNRLEPVEKLYSLAAKRGGYEKYTFIRTASYPLRRRLQRRASRMTVMYPTRQSQFHTGRGPSRKPTDRGQGGIFG